MEEPWHYAEGNEQRGPVLTAQLRQLLASGQLTLDTLVWQTGMPQWMPIGTIPQLHSAAIPPGFAPQAGYPGAAPAASLNYSIEHFQYAGFWLRFAAYVIDWLVLVVPFFVLTRLLAIPMGMRYMPGPGPTAPPPGLVFASCGLPIFDLVIIWLYFALMESSSRQGTLGKMAVGLKVTDLTGMQIGFGRATGRYFGKLLSGMILCIGFIMIAFTQRKQGLHDLMAETLVIRK